MTTIWILDSCICKLKLKKDRDGTIILDSWIQKCQVHKDELDSNLLDTIVTHNRIYQLDSVLRETEKIRIRNLGEPELNES